MASERRADPDCPMCGGLGYTEESHGMEGPWREHVTCDCIAHPPLSAFDAAQDPKELKDD